jgi:hypothetical protein
MGGPGSGGYRPNAQKTGPKPFTEKGKSHDISKYFNNMPETPPLPQSPPPPNPPIRNIVVNPPLSLENDDFEDLDEFKIFNSGFERFTLDDDIPDEDCSQSLEEIEAEVEKEEYIPRDSVVHEYLCATRELIRLDRAKDSGRKYANGINWIRAEPISFKASDSFSPNQYYHFDILYFNPFDLKGIEAKCVRCSGYLNQKGFPHNPLARLVRGVGSIYYIMAYELQCDNCKKRYYTTNVEIMAQYPLFIQEAFPALLTNCAQCCS